MYRLSTDCVSMLTLCQHSVLTGGQHWQFLRCGQKLLGASTTVGAAGPANTAAYKTLSTDQLAAHSPKACQITVLLSHLSNGSFGCPTTVVQVANCCTLVVEQPTLRRSTAVHELSRVSQ